jgi:subtilase family serine protease
MTNNSSIVSAEVILKSQTGRSLVNENLEITSENVEEFYPSKKNIDNAIDILQQMGFQVSSSDLSLTIVGKAEQFEKVFNTKLRFIENKEGMSISFDKDPEIPSSLQDMVETLVFSPPVKYM